MGRAFSIGGVGLVSDVTFAMFLLSGFNLFKFDEIFVGRK